MTLAWDANTEPDLDGYKLRYGTTSGSYPDTVDVGDVLSATLSGLEPDTYYIAVTAYNEDGLESAASNEVVFTATADSGFSAWQIANAAALGDEDEPADNPEGDEYANALEYALMLDPGSGINSEPFCVELDPSSGEIDASFRRPAGGGVDATYTLEVVSNPTETLSWNAWSGPAPGVQDNGDGSETVTYPDLEASVGVRGMARLRVELTGDATGPHYTPLFGWDTVDSVAGSQTCSYPYAAMSVFGGSLAAGIFNPQSGLIPADGADGTIGEGSECYLEFVAGPFAGHRFDLMEDSTTATHFVLDLAGAGNTLSPVPSDLAGGFAIRPVMTLGELINPQLGLASGDPDIGDQVIRYDGNKWRSFWVYDGNGTIPAQWTEVDDDELLDAGDTVISPGEGVYLRASGSYLPVTRVGVVRQWPFACPLNPGFNLIGGGFPIDQSPSSRAMQRDDGDGFQDWFTANNDPLFADQVYVWLGDEVPGANGYQTYFRVNLGIPEYDHWADQTDSFLTNADDASLFEWGRAVIYSSVNGHDRSKPDEVWRWPVPWVAAP